MAKNNFIQIPFSATFQNVNGFLSHTPKCTLICVNCPLEKMAAVQACIRIYFTESLHFVSTDLYLEGPILCFKLPILN